MLSYNKKYGHFLHNKIVINFAANICYRRTKSKYKVREVHTARAETPTLLGERKKLKNKRSMFVINDG